jgi:hypothetical protein
VQSQPSQSFVVTIVPANPTDQTTVADVLIGSLGITAVLLGLALALGVLAAAVRYGWNRLHPPSEDHLPPVSPFTEPGVPPSSRAQ